MVLLSLIRTLFGGDKHSGCGREHWVGTPWRDGVALGTLVDRDLFLHGAEKCVAFKFWSHCDLWSMRSEFYI